ncbi:Sec63 Brl domain containing protein [Amanita muscaria]
MAKYSYDEAGNMAGYFLITFLALVLVPATFSTIKPLPQAVTDGCQCTPCKENRQRLEKLQKGFPKITKKAVALLLGWSLLGYVSFRVVGATVENKVYDPFEILGIGAGASEKEIKSHFKRLSLRYHPDKVRATANQTIEMIQQKFVDITKAYKSLTDETIRKNWELYGNPDGRQEMSMGIALPQWIIASKNNVWVLSVYGLLFGGALPALVGRWWFGSRERTKDGVHARSAAEYFKSLREESNMDQIISTLSKSFTWEHPAKSSTSDADELQRLEHEITAVAGKAWQAVQSVIREGNDACKRAFVLVFAHLLRLEVKRSSLVKEQVQILQQTPVLLNSLLNITLARNWLFPSLDIMRLHAYLVQALPPSPSFMTLKDGVESKLTNPRAAWFAQLPGITSADGASHTVTSYNGLIQVLDDKSDNRVPDIKRALSKWGHVDLVDISFKVIGERVVSPSSIVYLVVKLRLKSPISQPSSDKNTAKQELDADQVKRRVKLNDELEEEFLKSRNDAEDLNDSAVASAVHAPHWPGERKPSWWIVLADDKSNRVVVPPLKITDIPSARLPEADAHEALLQHDYRAYKIQFQSPPNIGMFTWKVYVVSDTFVGEEVTRDITMKIEEAPLSASDEMEDEISEPDEDSLAGQMAAMRGGSVKKRKEESDDDSLEEDSDKNDSSSDSDSD